MFPYLNLFYRNIPTYGVCLALAIVVAGSLAYFRCKKLRLSGDDFLIIAVTAIGLGLVVAWGFYVAVTFSFRQIVEVIRIGKGELLLQGGMVFYGGVFGGL